MTIMAIFGLCESDVEEAVIAIFLDLDMTFSMGMKSHPVIGIKSGHHLIIIS
jgi:hypothetical protein